MKSIANIMCVLNEAEYIEAALRSIIPGCDQIIVLDQGSTDGTMEICETVASKYGPRKISVVSTYGQTFLTRGEQFFRNLALDLCFCDWMMVTDGDEIMSDGWEKIVKPFLNEQGDNYGAIRCNYWQMMGTSGYHTVDSPLQYSSGERPLFYRKCDTLRAGDPMRGTKVHVAFVGIDPSPVARMEVDCFHMGYAKSDLEARFRRNIERGDWTACKDQEDKLKEEFFKAAKTEPLNLLWPCVPNTFLKERLPMSIREPKFDCEYDVPSRRIKSRTPR